MLLSGHIPIRTCVGCGAHRSQAELLRIYATPEGTVDLDPARRHGGRGAYLCWKVECLWEAVRRNRFPRVLHRSLRPQDESSLGVRFGERLREHLLRRLHTARRAGAALPGPADGIAAGDVRLVVLADGEPPPAYECPIAGGGPREALALALQAPGATFAAVLSESLAREIVAIAAARNDFQRPPPPRRRGRGPRGRGEMDGDASAAGEGGPGDPGGGSGIGRLLMAMGARGDGAREGGRDTR